ncbi:MAG TPA: hypothetical protein VMU70_00265, partial [Candidatus Tyrphobacter sp.]|nr:hypothetical protein [Candidatus Tyrphobacter sp.]
QSLLSFLLRTLIINRNTSAFSFLKKTGTVSRADANQITIIGFTSSFQKNPTASPAVSKTAHINICLGVLQSTTYPLEPSSDNCSTSIRFLRA